MNEMKNAQELNEQELAKVVGAGRDSLPVSEVCPNCTSDQFAFLSDKLVRKCTACGTKYRYGKIMTPSAGMHG